MAVSTGEYRGWWLSVLEPWEGMSAFFVVGPGPDPRMVWGIRGTWDEAMVAGRKTIIREAQYESSTRNSG